MSDKDFLADLRIFRDMLNGECEAARSRADWSISVLSDERLSQFHNGRNSAYRTIIAQLDKLIAKHTTTKREELK